MVLIAILSATLIAGIGSVWLAAALGFVILARFTQHLLSFAAGALLATAFLHLLPEAFESAIEARRLFSALLVGLVFFFVLDKAELWHHGHEHHHDEEAGLESADRAAHGGSRLRARHRRLPKPGSWAVLAGDSVHCFGDGVLIASAFIADLRLGAVAALAVLAHEVPHHMGDLAVLRQHAGNDRAAALLKVSLAGSVTTLGGLAGYLLLDQLRDWLAYFLVAASSSFIYVALADLIPQLQRPLGARATAAQVGWLLAGILLVALVGSVAHRHAH